MTNIFNIIPWPNGSFQGQSNKIKSNNTYCIINEFQLGKVTGSVVYSKAQLGNCTSNNLTLTLMVFFEQDVNLDHHIQVEHQPLGHYGFILLFIYLSSLRTTIDTEKQPEIHAYLTSKCAWIKACYSEINLAPSILLLDMKTVSLLWCLISTSIEFPLEQTHH